LGRAALFGAIATLILLAPIATARAQTVRIAKSTVAPSRVVPRLDALPQRVPGQQVATVKPLLYRVDPLTFSVLKDQAKSQRFTAKGVSPGAPARAASASGRQSLNQTVNPPEIVFDGISNASCATVNGGANFRPSDMALAVGDVLVGVLQGVNDCI